MFSHTINNPNNFIFEQKNNFFAIPFGHRCTSALACKYSNIRDFSLPFDWTTPLFPKKIIKVLEENFNDFIPDVYQNIFTNKYDITLAHFNPNINDGVEEYKRRIERFNDVMINPKKKYFIHINEDYFYNNYFRDENFNNGIFNEMLELENFLKEKYINIDYNILYFNFKHYDIPSNSNIINIVLHTDTLYDSENLCGYRILHFREYCAKILKELFNTNLIINSSYDIFYN